MLQLKERNKFIMKNSTYDYCSSKKFPHINVYVGKAMLAKKTFIRSCFLFLLLCCSCGHMSEDRTEYQVDLGKIRNNAKSSLAGDEEAFRAKVKLEDDKIAVAKKNSPYGLIKIELSCQKSETSVPATVLASALGTNPRSDSYIDCKQYGYSNWLKLSWSCKSEHTNFIKSKTTSALRSGAKLLLLDTLGGTLDTINLVVNSGYESFDPVSDETFSNVKRLKVLARGTTFLVEKSDWAHTITLPDELCGL